VKSSTVKLLLCTLISKSCVWQLHLVRLKVDNGAARLAALEKELRAHIETSERMNRTTDKRGLVLAGADRVMRELN
jgi:hypothetical protein